MFRHCYESSPSLPTYVGSEALPMLILAWPGAESPHHSLPWPTGLSPGATECSPGQHRRWPWALSDFTDLSWPGPLDPWEQQHQRYQAQAPSWKMRPRVNSLNKFVPRFRDSTAARHRMSTSTHTSPIFVHGNPTSIGHTFGVGRLKNDCL